MALRESVAGAAFSTHVGGQDKELAAGSNLFTLCLPMNSAASLVSLKCLPEFAQFIGPFHTWNLHENKR